MKTSLVVIIPAYNEEGGISATLSSLSECEDNADIVVIADNCTDKTEEIANQAGVRVIRRTNSLLRGKQHALSYAFSVLLSEGYDHFAIVDADTLVEKNFIGTLQKELLKGSKAVQVNYIQSQHQESYFQRLLSLAFTGVNQVKPRGRQFWGLSCGIFGNGFALTREILLHVPFNASSIAEDVEYHINLVMSGYKVAYTDQTTVYAKTPNSNDGLKTQRARWIGGRLGLLQLKGPQLLRNFFKGNFRIAEPLLDLLTPPLSIQTFAVCILFLMPFEDVKIYAYLALLAILLYCFTAIRFHQGGWRDWAALVFAPFFIFYNVLMIPNIIKASKQLFWKRTER